MAKGIFEVREYIRQQYANLYGRPNWQFPEIPSLDNAGSAWLWQTADLRRATSVEEASGAVLLDSEIGTCLYIQVYDTKIPARQQLSRALQVRSSLLPMSGKRRGAQADKLGAWRVVLHWLVERADLSAWIDEVAEIREQTAHFEEIPVDAIVERNGEWSAAIQEHGIPRLLFRVRGILKKRQAEQVERWQSADFLVAEDLARIGDVFAGPISRQCAKEVLSFLAKQRESYATRPRSKNAASLDLFKLTLENFRNIDRLSIDFRSSHNTVDATVVQGPNGSGKSSVFEALALAVTHASPRYEAYLNDKSRSLFGRGDAYLTDYLPNLSAADRVVHVGLNSAETSPLVLAPEAEVRERVERIGGTFLSQEASRSFVRMSAAELGAEIAAGLSVIADDVLEFVGGQLSSAQNQLRAFNAKWGLRANVVRKETVLEQVAERTLNAFLPNVSEIVGWLEAGVLSGLSIGQQSKILAERWSAWRGRTSGVIASMVKALADETSGSALIDHVASLNDLIANTTAIYGQIDERLGDWLPDDETRLHRWGLWLQQLKLAPKGDDEAIIALRVREREIGNALATLTEVGRLIAGRMQHLANAKVFVEDWARTHATTCPTCESEVANRGGIEAVVQAASIAVQDELKRSRLEYANLKKSLDSLAAELGALGAGTSPISSDEKVRLTQQVGWLLPSDLDLEGVATNQVERERLLARIRHVRVRPPLPLSHSAPEAEARELTKKMRDISQEHDQVSRLPEAWKEVEREVRQRLASITAAHLPSTLQALWLEVAKNMMPAAWQQPGQLEFRTGSRRTPEASVVVKGETRTVLANHILNGAEVHNLGLAWFFTKYLTVGRFRHRFMVLDDPSDTMDQTTYRDLCRFLETLLRLHRVDSIPLSLVVLLHEDQRALDVTRATGAVLYRLRWNRRTKTLSRPLRVFGEQVTSPLPTAVLEAS